MSEARGRDPPARERLTSWRRLSHLPGLAGASSRGYWRTSAPTYVFDDGCWPAPQLPEYFSLHCWPISARVARHQALRFKRRTFNQLRHSGPRFRCRPAFARLAPRWSLSRNGLPTKRSSKDACSFLRIFGHKRRSMPALCPLSRQSAPFAKPARVCPRGLNQWRRRLDEPWTCSCAKCQPRESWKVKSKSQKK